VAGHRGFVQDETSTGFDRLGTPTSQQIVTLGNAERPALATDLTFSVFPSSILTLTNQTSFLTSAWWEFIFSRKLTNGVFTSFLPSHFWAFVPPPTSSDADLRVNKWMSLHGGYQYSRRQIGSIEGADVPNVPTPPLARVPLRQDNRLQDFVAGVRLRPLAGVSVLLDTEVGLANRPFYPISQRDYQTYRGRIEYKRKSYRLAAYSRTDNNPTPFRWPIMLPIPADIGIDGSWALKSWFSIDASYAKLHLNTLGAITSSPRDPPSGRCSRSPPTCPCT